MTSTALWETELRGPQYASLRAVEIPVDLTNGGYRAYVWVTSTADLDNAGNQFKGWTQSVTPPATPTMAITPGDATTPTEILLDAASVATGGRYLVEYHDQDAPDDDWLYVEGAYLVVPTVGTNEATVSDSQARFGMARHYRAKQVVESPWLAGSYSAEQSVVIDSDIWTLTDAQGETPGIEFRPKDEFNYDRKFVGEEHWPDGRTKAVMIWGEVPIKAKSFTLSGWLRSQAEVEAAEALVLSRHVLLLRDPYHRGTFVAFSGDQSWSHPSSAPEASDTTPGGWTHSIEVPVVEVARPLVGPAEGTLALVGSDA